MCWLAVTATTVVFLVVAVVSALPKMKAAYTASIASIFLTASGITAFGSLAPLLSVAGLAPPVTPLLSLSGCRHRPRPVRRWPMTPPPARWCSPSTTGPTSTRRPSSRS